MKSSKLVVVFAAVLAFAATSAFAVQTPAARTCRIAGGQPWDLAIPNDEVELCLFGRGMVGSMAFYSVTALNQETQATNAYLNQSDLGASANAQGACSQAGGNVIQGTDSNGSTFSLCQFADSSLIEVNTLARGPQAVENRELTEKLKSRTQ